MSLHAASSGLHRSHDIQGTFLPQAASVETLGTAVDGSIWDDLSRKVYCVLGLPIDSLDMSALVKAVEDAATRKTAFVISTPNLNHLVMSQRDNEFRESLLLSELCAVDGMPIVWMARLLGLPIKERVAGADLFEALTATHRSAKQLKVFLFGGAEGVAKAAAKALNQRPGGLNCVGSIYPGYDMVEHMSRDPTIEEINASGADFLLVSLGAKKGQSWLLRNHHRLRIPVRAHLGATINFAAGKFRRAPHAFRKLGFEWLWRIKEEPKLWRRYWNDGVALIRLLLTRIVPLAIWTRWQRLRQHTDQDLAIRRTHDQENLILSLCGAACALNVDKAAAIFRQAVAGKRTITVDLSETRVVDARFIGLLLMLRKQAIKRGAAVKFTASSRLRRVFRLHGVGFLLDLDHK